MTAPDLADALVFFGATFGASAPGVTVFKQYGFTTENVVRRALALVGR